MFVDLFNSSAGNPAATSIPVTLQETTEDYIQKILTACCSQQGAGIPGFPSVSTAGSSGLRVNEFKPSEYRIVHNSLSVYTVIFLEVFRSIIYLFRTIIISFKSDFNIIRIIIKNVGKFIR